MSFVLDVHAHMSDAAFADDLAAVLQRAQQQADVHHIVSVSTNITDAQKVLRLSESYSMILPAIGLHPCYIASITRSQMMSELEELAALVRRHDDKLVAIGEIGLDFMPRVLKEGIGTVEEVKERMFESFRFQVNLAKEMRLPVSVHSRSAGHYAIEVVKDEVRACMHAWDGKLKYALNATEDDGMYFSIPPSVVRDPQTCKLVERIDWNHLLVETDSPALGPVARKPNEPMNIILSVKKIAELKKKTVDEVKQVLDSNSRRIFPQVFR